MRCDEKMREEILGRLSGYRYTHTLGVERAAIKLAEQYGADVEKCAFAALLHDITKHFSQEEQLNLCEKYGIIPSIVESKEYKMLHGKTAAGIASHVYHAPQDVVDAVACHTTGKAGMTLLDKVLYLADYIEEGRSFDGVEQARYLAVQDIDKALLYCFENTLVELISRGKIIHSDTIAAYNDLVAQGVRWRTDT